MSEEANTTTGKGLESSLGNFELEDNFFEKDDIAQEEAFKTEFDSPLPFNEMLNKGMTPGTGEAGQESGTGTETNKEDDDGTVDFKFDDALAEEERKELEELNAKMGTDFKSRNELNEALKKVEQHDQTKEIDEERGNVAYIEKLLNPQIYDDEMLIREDQRLKFAGMQKNLNDQDVIDAIETEVSRLMDSGMASLAAQFIRGKLETQLEKRQAKIKSFEESQKLTIEEKQKKFKQELQEGINDIFKQGKFLGVTPTKEDLLDIYKDISKNKHIEHLKAHPKDAVQFALFKKYQNVIEKILAKPNFEAGVKSALQEMGMASSSQTGQSGSAKPKSGDEEVLTFLQSFAK